MLKDKSLDGAGRESLTKLALVGIFLSIFAGLARRKSTSIPEFQEFHLTPLEFLQLVLSTYRLGRMVAFDTIFEPIRAPVAHTVPDPSGAGETVEPRGEGMQRALGEMISCPICAGTWIAALLVYGMHFFPHPTRLLLAMMSAVGGAELLNAISEAFQWEAHAARRATGEMKPEARPIAVDNKVFSFPVRR